MPPTLRSLELRRSGTSSGAPPPHLRALLAECALEDVRRLKCAEHTIPVSGSKLLTTVKHVKVAKFRRKNGCRAWQ